VLDYKIKDLKREITPQQNKILELKKETNELDGKLKFFNQVNSGLGLTVDDNRTRQEQMQKSITNSRAQIRRNETYIRSYRNAVYWVA
jgi:chromosome segregation ATPase